MQFNKDQFAKYVPSVNNSRVRPQTPQPQSSFNPTFKNFHPRNQMNNHQFDAPQYPNLSKSRLSMNSSSSGLGFLNQTDQNEMFP